MNPNVAGCIQSVSKMAFEIQKVFLKSKNHFVIKRYLHVAKHFKPFYICPVNLRPEFQKVNV